MANSKITYVFALDTKDANAKINKMSDSLDKLGTKKGQKVIDFDQASITQIEEHLNKLLKLQKDLQTGAKKQVKASDYAVYNQTGNKAFNTQATKSAINSAIGKTGDAYVQKFLLELDQAELAKTKAKVADFYKQIEVFAKQAADAEAKAYKDAANEINKLLALKRQAAQEEVKQANLYDKQTAKIQAMLSAQAARLRASEAITAAIKKERDANIQNTLARLDVAKLSQITQQSIASARTVADAQARLATETSSRQQQIEQQRINWVEQARLTSIRRLEDQSLASIRRLEAADRARIEAINAREKQLASQRAEFLRIAQGGTYNGATLGSGAASSKASNTYTPDLRASADKQTGLIKGMYETQTAYNERVKESIRLLEQAKSGVLNLGNAHKPFLERIFDLVVGYKLINAAVNTFTNAIKSIPDAGLQYETTYATLKATFSVTTKVNEQLAFLDKLAQDAGISITALRTSFVEFAASAKFSGESVGNIQEIFANISKAGMVLHLPADKMKSAFTALNQMYAKNQVMMEELKRQLGNQLPAAVNIFALSMGKTTRQLMDDMKKGLVVPKETLLNFSRTYAAMFADDASLKYASQGVNAHIQRLSTAWTNFATKVYEQSKGALKGGLSIATNALDFLSKHMDGLTNAVVGLGTALAGALIVHLGAATVAYMQASKAVIAFAAAQSLARGVTIATGELGILTTIKAFTVGTLAAIPPWIKLVAVLGTAVMVLKDLEVGTVSVMSSLDQASGMAVEIQKSITVGDVALASWDILLEKSTTYWDKFSEWYAKNSQMTPLPNGKAPNVSYMDMIGYSSPIIAPIYGAGKSLVNQGRKRAEQDAIAKSNAEEATRQTEYINEKVKEALLAGTTNTVDETMAGMTKIVSNALQRISTEFDMAAQKLNGETSLKIKELQFEITKVKAQEASGAITKLDAMKKTQAIQREIQAANRKALEGEISLLDKQLAKIELIGETKLSNSKEATKVAAGEEALAKSRDYQTNISKTLTTLQGTPYTTQGQAAEALSAGTVSDKLISEAIAKFNADNPTRPLLGKLDVTNTALAAQVKALDKARDEYAKITAEHTALQQRVAEGTDTSNNLLSEIAKNTNPDKVQQVEDIGTGAVSSGVTDITATDAAKKAIDFFISKGWKPAQAAGITANLQGESGLNIAAKGDGGSAFGLAQWHGDRQANFAKTFGKSIKNSSFEDQLAFVDWELKNTEARAGNLLKATKTVAEATNTVTASYERPAKVSKDQAIRREIASTYLPSSAYLKSGAEPVAQAGLAVEQKKLDKLSKVAELSIDEKQTKFEAEQANLLEQLQQTKTNLLASLQLSKTKKETELAKLDTTAFPVSNKQHLEKTAAINASTAPELTSKIDELIKNAKEEILRTADQAKVSGLESEILNLQKERASIEAETLKDKSAVALNKIIPLQDALEKKQFDIQKALEDNLGIFNEQSFKLSQQIGQEETLKLLEAEKIRISSENNGLSKEEIASKTQLIALTEKNLAQLNQIELMKAKIAKSEEKTSTFQGYSDAASANMPFNQASKMGVSGNFVGAYAAQETARNNYGAKQTNLESQIAAYKEAQKGLTGTNEWYKLQTQIEQTTTAMNDLAMAKDAVLNQATADTMNSISDHFVAWANGAETVKQAFKGIAIDFAKMIQEIIMNELKMLAVKGIMSLISGGLGGAAAGGSIGSGGTTGATSSIGIAGFAGGGDVRGTGTGTSDSIPSVVPVGSFVLNAKASAKAKRNRLINLSHGEVVISPEQVAHLGLDNLNKINAQGYATGGLVGSAATSSSNHPSGKNSNVYNINVAVPEGTTNPKAFGKDAGIEIYKAIAAEEAKKQINMYNKQKQRRA